MICGVAKENTWSRAGLEFVSGMKVREAKETEDTKVIVCWMSLKKTIVGSFIRNRDRG